MRELVGGGRHRVDSSLVPRAAITRPTPPGSEGSKGKQALSGARGAASLSLSEGDRDGVYLDSVLPQDLLEHLAAATAPKQMRVQAQLHR